MAVLNDHLLKVAGESCNEEGGLTASQMKDLFKLALLAVRQTKRISPTSTQLIWRSQSWVSLNRNLKNSRFKASTGLQKMCEQIARTSEVASDTSAKIMKTSGSKRKMEEIATETATSDVKKSKRKKSKE